ncbi:MAG: hypothetical protein ACE144_09700 [Thermodesulfobacteriota bacterium]
MKRIKPALVFFLLLGLLGVSHVHTSYAQKPLHTLTLLYSNNINGEIDPCPT